MSHGYFHTIPAFLQMGGSAAYVWSAYAVVLLGLLFLIVSTKRKAKRLRSCK